MVLGCAVWSYFQTLSTRQSTYAQVIVMGSGLSIMQVMALVFITELIGENKVGIVKRILLFLVLTRHPTKLSESRYGESSIPQGTPMEIDLTCLRRFSLPTPPMKRNCHLDHFLDQLRSIHFGLAKVPQHH